MPKGGVMENIMGMKKISFEKVPIKDKKELVTFIDKYEIQDINVIKKEYKDSKNIKLELFLISLTGKIIKA